MTILLHVTHGPALTSPGCPRSTRTSRRLCAFGASSVVTPFPKSSWESRGPCLAAPPHTCTPKSEAGGECPVRIPAIDLSSPCGGLGLCNHLRAPSTTRSNSTIRRVQQCRRVSSCLTHNEYASTAFADATDVAEGCATMATTTCEITWCACMCVHVYASVYIHIGHVWCVGLPNATATMTHGRTLRSAIHSRSQSDLTWPNAQISHA